MAGEWLEIEQAQIYVGTGESDVNDRLYQLRRLAATWFMRARPGRMWHRASGRDHDGVFRSHARQRHGRWKGSVDGNAGDRLAGILCRRVRPLWLRISRLLRRAGTEPLGEIVLESKHGPVTIRAEK